MAGQLLHVGATILCPHAGQASIISTNTRVKVSGQAVAVLNDTTTIAGCAFTVGTVPQPCIKVQWLVPAVRVKVNGQAALLSTSSGLCQSATQVPQGPPQVVVTQMRVRGS
jgi:hypothetical protein